MFSSREDSQSAVLFFAPEGVVKELLYSEFEALLEGFTPEIEWAGRDAKAVYLELSPDLKPKSAVFFKLSFDDEGWVEASWNVPLVNLARTAQPGPNLGAGAMRTATAKQCPDARYTEMLWAPDLGAGSKILEWIQGAIAVNRLGLSRQAVAEDPAQEAQAGVGQASGISAGVEAQLAQLLQNQMLGANGMAQTMAQLEQTKTEYEQKLATLQVQLADQVRQFDSAKEQLATLEQSVAGKEKKLAEVREYYELKLEKTKGCESDYIRALREHYETEASEQVANAESEYKELLNWREVELMYRAERESQLHEEITKLRLRIAELEQTSGNDVLHKLSDKGITFMTYQVGLGHIAIPADDIALYLANPIGFVAAFCNVTQAVYLDWLAHFHAPVCRAQDSNGEYCGVDVMRIDSPEQYLPGASDCCDKHRSSA
ncbi:hypothetical protein [Marinagarivorans cellulosilyticus]|uniref:Uncharacterized protein n=1 Tax=Marinagarivorans cellulosilyticus TaxID=2721545 RepID=A0AAN1WIX9_9GAMM|nr:hypothetical protein [Marinagarivorans cellulosilyticus]BCD98439.1 hypothetical protein MARGE09_P2640 [Marinagarivorans cellulosilyticus]